MGRQIEELIDGQANGLTGRLTEGGLKDEWTDELTKRTQRNTDRETHVKTDSRMHGGN